MPTLTKRSGNLALKFFSFAEDSGEGLLACLDRACAGFADKRAWQGLQRTAMTRDFGWSEAARRYLALYRDLLQPDDPRT